MATIQIPNSQVSPLEALWSLYQNQTDCVKKAFLKRVNAQSKAEREEAEMRSIEAAMSVEQRTSLHHMAHEVRKRAKDVEEAVEQGKSVGKDAEDFLAELRAGLSKDGDKD